MFFAEVFILNENILFGLFLLQLFVFSVSVFCSEKVILKLNIQPKTGLTIAVM